MGLWRPKKKNLRIYPVTVVYAAVMVRIYPVTVVYAAVMVTKVVFLHISDILECGSVLREFFKQNLRFS